jgi:hypothetical protein
LFVLVRIEISEIECPNTTSASAGFPHQGKQSVSQRSILVFAQVLFDSCYVFRVKGNLSSLLSFICYWKFDLFRKPVYDSLIPSHSSTANRNVLIEFSSVVEARFSCRWARYSQHILLSRSLRFSSSTSGRSVHSRKLLRRQVCSWSTFGDKPRGFTVLSVSPEKWADGRRRI